MRRVQWIELEDQPWLPAPVRDAATALLDLMVARMGLYDGVVPDIAAVVAATGATHLVDLCSGAGGPAVRARQQLRAHGYDVGLTLTDLYPSAVGRRRVDARPDAGLSYRPDAVDARTGGPLEPVGVRTMFGALHHFPPDAVHALLAGLVARRQPLCLVDITASPLLRRLPPVAVAPLIGLNAVVVAVVALVLAPAVRPVRPLHLLLTYLPPVMPFVFAWDGTVSALRAYTPDDILAIARTVPGAGAYEWSGAVRGRAWVVTGVPRA